jgi:hypothetical protein
MSRPASKIGLTETLEPCPHMLHRVHNIDFGKFVVVGQCQIEQALKELVYLGELAAELFVIYNFLHHQGSF